MDSFFSLFEPGEGGARAGGAARRRRRAGGKAARAPEDSSFLCEPALSADVHVKDVGYIESHMEARCGGAGGGGGGAEAARARRGGARKARRKKKPSPPKELVQRRCWTEENLFYPERYRAGREPERRVAWNNEQAAGRQRRADSLGKNVNDLLREQSPAAAEEWEYGRRCGRRAEPFNLERQADGDAAGWLPLVGAVPELESEAEAAEGLEEAGARGELLPAGDAPPELDGDVFYSSDEEDGNVGDSSSDMEEDSGGEVYGSLPPEPQLGNVEYKLQLVGPSEKRFQHLVTQLKWRLRSGGGSAVYVLGVRDCGALRGLRARDLRASLRTLRRMAAALRATVRRVAARRVAPHRAVAEVYIRKLADTQQSVELRVAVMGANEAGKSTLVGVLTQGELDNGRGSARLNMFRHLHEVRSGRTSSLSHEILGFDAQGDVVNYGCSELMTAERIGERSAKLVSFLDLAGHSKYQRTTVHGLTGYSPHYAMLVVSATAGIGRMTEEHLGLLLALDLPFFIVVTRVELAPAEPHALLARFREFLRAAGCQKRPLLISNEQQARTCATPVHTPILDKLDGARDDDTDKPEEMVPVFPVSCVSGEGLNSLHSYLLAAEPPADPLSHLQPDPQEEACEFQVDEIFRVGGGGEPVVGGLLARGVLHEGDTLLIGPLDWGDFVPITVRSIYRNRVPCGAVRAGQSASLGLSRRPPGLRQGMVLLALPPGYAHPDLPAGRPAGAADPRADGCASDNVSDYSNLPDLHCLTGEASKASQMNSSLDDLMNLASLADSVDNCHNTADVNSASDNDDVSDCMNLSDLDLLTEKNYKNASNARYSNNLNVDGVDLPVDSENNYVTHGRGLNEKMNAGVNSNLNKNMNDILNANSSLDKRNSDISSINTLPDYKNLYFVPDHHLRDASKADSVAKNQNFYSSDLKVSRDHQPSKTNFVCKSNLVKVAKKENIEDFNLKSATNNQYCDRTNLKNTADQQLMTAKDVYSSNFQAIKKQNSDSCNLKTSPELELNRTNTDFSRNSITKMQNINSSNLKTSPDPRLNISNDVYKLYEAPERCDTGAGSGGETAGGGTELDRRKAERAARWDVKNFKRKEKNLLRDIARAESGLVKRPAVDIRENLYRSDSDSEAGSAGTLTVDGSGRRLVAADGESSGDEVLLDDPADPRGSLYFQATVRVLRHSTAIYPGFQATVHIGNIRQTAVIEGIMSSNSVLRAGESASVVFRFARQPEYVRAGRKVLFRAGLETRGVGRLTQVFPCARRKCRAAAV